MGDLRAFFQSRSSADQADQATGLPSETSQTFVRSSKSLVKKPGSKAQASPRKSPKKSRGGKRVHSGSDAASDCLDDDEMLSLDASQLRSQEDPSLVAVTAAIQETSEKSRLAAQLLHDVHSSPLKAPALEHQSGDEAVARAMVGKRRQILRISDEDSDGQSPVASPKTSPRKTARSTKTPSTPLPADIDVETTNPDDLLVAEKKPFNYFQMLANRSSAPINPGTLEVPEGLPNCLAGFSFVFTGSFMELGRDEMLDFAKRYGAKVVSVPSKRTSFVVLGDNPGPSKIEKAKEHHLKCLTEEQFYKLVKSQPAKTDEGHPLPNQPLLDHPPPKAAPKELLAEAASKLQKMPDRDSSGDLWTVKYSPSDVSHIIGNQGNILKLRQWLQSWKRNRIPEARAVLISGPPGIGKTTSAQIVSKAEGFKVLEYNASDTRSKKALHDTIMDMLNNRSMAEFHGGGFFKPMLSKNANQAPVLKSAEKAVVIMDEVDGMSSGDRGGIAELILLIKKSKVPIICICNDRANPKVRNLANYCLDLRYRRPDARSIYPRLQEICQLEGLSISPNVVEQLVSSTHGDIRQIINILANWSISRTTLSYDESKQLSELSKKDTEKGPFDITAEFLSRASYSKHSVNQLLEYYFMDNSLIPLMIQENYLRCKPTNLPKNCTTKPQLDLASLTALSKAADSLVDSDIVDKKIHGANQEWSLSPLHGVLSCVIPSFFAGGALGGRIEFASWLGQNSKTMKSFRILTELTMHMCLHTSGGKSEIRESYLTPLIQKLTSPLVKDGTAGVDQVIALLDAYTILKEDYDSLLDLGIGKIDGPTLLAKIPTAVKSALTRTYNKEAHLIPYSIATLSKKQSFSPAMPEPEDREIELVDDDEEKDLSEDLSKDKMIKAKTSKAATAKKMSSQTKKRTPVAKKSAGGKSKQAEDSYDEGDGFVVDDDDHGPRKKRK